MHLITTGHKFVRVYHKIDFSNTIIAKKYYYWRAKHKKYVSAGSNSVSETFLDFFYKLYLDSSKQCMVSPDLLTYHHLNKFYHPFGNL